MRARWRLVAGDVLLLDNCLRNAFLHSLRPNYYARTSVSLGDEYDELLNS
jgi:hypothetical protein